MNEFMFVIFVIVLVSFTTYGIWVMMSDPHYSEYYEAMESEGMNRDSIERA